MACTVAALLITAVLAPVAMAATIVVTCSGPPVLQAAIDGAAADDTIDIGAGTCTENVTIDKNLTLRGAGAGSTFLDGGLAGTAVTISGGATVELAALTIRRGSASGGDPNGGGILLTGAGSVTIRDGVVTDNMAATDGGGIFSKDGGTITIIDSSVTKNVAGQNGGGVFSTSPDAAPTNMVVVVDSTISDNDANGDHGGGLFLTNTVATFTRSTLSGNDAGDDGGGIYAVGTGSTTLINVTISGNRANTSSGSGFGGAIFVRDPAFAATHSTIYDNTGFRGGGIAIGGLGLTTATLRATVLTGNRATSPTAPDPDCLRAAGAGTVVTTGFNLFGADAPADCAFTAAGSDRVGVDPRLGPLQDNGGPFTHALLAGSPAIDIVTSGCPPPATDERGVARPQGAYCDAGAYEAPPGPVPDTVGLVDPTQGQWHLRNSAGQVTSFFYGNPGDFPLMGDWDCNGTDTPGMYRQSDGFVYVRNSNTQGVADIKFFLGNPGDVPLAGDFNNNGCDTVSIYRPSEQRFYIANKLAANNAGIIADFSFLFGNPGDKPVVGDWDGDGIDEVGLHRETTGFFYWRNTLDTGIASAEIFFGDPADRFVAGDWGIVDSVDTPAIFRPSNTTFYFRHTLTQGIADSTRAWANAGSNWLPVAGAFGLG